MSPYRLSKWPIAIGRFGKTEATQDHSSFLCFASLFVLLRACLELALSPNVASGTFGRLSRDRDREERLRVGGWLGSYDRRLSGPEIGHGWKTEDLDHGHDEVGSSGECSCGLPSVMDVEKLFGNSRHSMRCSSVQADSFRKPCLCCHAQWTTWMPVTLRSFWGVTLTSDGGEAQMLTAWPACGLNTSWLNCCVVCVQGIMGPGEDDSRIISRREAFFSS